MQEIRGRRVHWPAPRLSRLEYSSFSDSRRSERWRPSDDLVALPRERSPASEVTFRTNDAQVVCSRHALEIGRSSQAIAAERQAFHEVVARALDVHPHGGACLLRLAALDQVEDVPVFVVDERQPGLLARHPVGSADIDAEGREPWRCRRGHSRRSRCPRRSPRRWWKSNDCPSLFSPLQPRGVGCLDRLADHGRAPACDRADATRNTPPRPRSARGTRSSAGGRGRSCPPLRIAGATAGSCSDEGPRSLDGVNESRRRAGARAPRGRPAARRRTRRRARAPTAVACCAGSGRD